ncbi:MAG: hypothetical protein AB7J28_11225 [Hyphomonadaceae bacterium]
MAWRLIAAALALASAPAATHVVRDEIWTAETPALARDLTHAPGECLPESARTNEVELGRALFRSSTVLGGPVARIGMSCHSCHTNGRANARFFLPELTNEIGAADVTSEWASAVRGDGQMNPIRIPDLAGVGSRQTFGHLSDPSLDHFVRSVVEEEFQGAPLSASAHNALIAYLRALDPARCATDGRATLRSAADDVRRALNAANATSDAESARLARVAARERIGLIVERLPARRFARERARLEALARELIEQPGDQGWRARFDALTRTLERRERATYFNERTLARALRTPGTTR